MTGKALLWIRSHVLPGLMPGKYHVIEARSEEGQPRCSLWRIAGESNFFFNRHFMYDHSHWKQTKDECACKCPAEWSLCIYVKGLDLLVHSDPPHLGHCSYCCVLSNRQVWRAIWQQCYTQQHTPACPGERQTHGRGMCRGTCLISFCLFIYHLLFLFLIWQYFTVFICCSFIRS